MKSNNELNNQRYIVKYWYDDSNVHYEIVDFSDLPKFIQNLIDNENSIVIIHKE